MIDHDRLFKELLSTFFVDFVDLFLPEAAGYLDKATVEMLDKEVFTDVTAGERHVADLVVKARFKGEDSCFLIHVETQARQQEEFARRMFRYFARLYEKHGLPVYPVALFSYESPERPEPDTHDVTFPDLEVLRFRFRTIQLNRLNWRDFLRLPNPVAAALMSKMSVAPEERPKVKVECLRLMASLKLDPARMQLIAGFVDTYLRLNAEEETLFRADVARLEEPQGEVVMEIVTSWMEQGIEKGLAQGLAQGLVQGRQEGRQEGLQEGELSLISRQLTRKLGPLPDDLVVKLKVLSPAQLEELGEALLGFSERVDLVAWLAGHPSEPERT